MQSVSKKWKDTQKNLLLPQQNISISFWDIDFDVIGYTDTTYTVPALGDVPPALSTGVYNIYFENGIELNNKVISLVMYNEDDWYYVTAYITIYGENYGDEDDPIESAEVISQTDSCKYLISTTEDVFRIKISLVNFENFIYLKKVNIEKEYIFDKGNILSASFKQSVDLLSLNLPENSFSFTLDNSDDAYNPENPNNRLAGLDVKSLITVDITQNYEDGTHETIKGGQYFIDEWDIPQNGITADFSARDGITFLHKKAQFTQSVPLIDDRYRRCDEITLNGSKGIKTNLRLQNNLESMIVSVYINFIYRGIPNGTKQYIFGVYEGQRSNFSFFVDESGYFAAQFTDGNIEITNEQAVQGREYNFVVTADYYNAGNNKYTTLEILESGYFIGYNSYDYTGGTDVSFPYYTVAVGAFNNGGTMQKAAAFTLTADVKITKRTEWTGAEEILAQFTPVQDSETSHFGIYDMVNSYFVTTDSEGSGVTGDASSDYNSLYYTTYFLFTNSGIPNTLDNQTRYSDISETLKKISTAGVDFQNIDNSYAEAIQLCANAGKCVWYWDRQGVSHIIPFDIPERLPEKYLPCAYVELPNNNTNLFVKTDIAVNGKAIYLDYFIPNVGTQVILGTNRSGSNHYRLVLGNSKYNISFNGTAGAYGTPLAGQKTEFIFNGLQNYKMSASGTVLTSGTEAATPQAGAKGYLLLGAWLDGGNHTMTSNFNGRFCRCTAVSRETGTVVAELEPCINKETGTVLLYDKVSGKEYTPVSYSYSGGQNIYTPTGAFTCEYNYQGAVQDFKDLPTSGMNDSDLYIVTSQNAGVVYDSGRWICLDYDFKNMCYAGYGTTLSDLPAQANYNDIYVLYISENNETQTAYYYYDGNEWQEFEYGKPIENYIIDRFNSFQNADISMTEQLSAVQINDDLMTYNIQNEGVVQEIKNPLIVDKDHAFDVARWIARILKYRRELSGEFRPDTRLDALDKIAIKNKYSENDVYITDIEYSYNGAFNGEYNGKVIT